MTDDHALQPRRGRAGEDSVPSTDAIGAGHDHTPAEAAVSGGASPADQAPSQAAGQAGAAAVDQPAGQPSMGPGFEAPAEHSAWMRPPEGEQPTRDAELDITPDLEPHEPGPVAPEGGHEGSPSEGASHPRSAESTVVAEGTDETRPTAPGAASPASGATAADDDHGRSAWLRLWPWLVAALALGLIASGLIYNNTRKAPVVVTQTPTPTRTVTPVVVNSDLLSVQDAAKLDAKQKWTATEVEQKVTPSSPRAVCIQTNPGQPNPTLSKLRALSTDQRDRLQVLHQVDAYATAAEAQKVFQLRAGNMGLCDGAPAWIAGADAVKGLGDQATAITVAFQEPVAEYHTVLLVRTGTTVHLVDAARNAKAVDSQALVAAAAAPIGRQCGRAEGTCPKNPTATATLPPPAGLAGWLIPADLPRVTPGAGLWEATEPRVVETTGSLCEQMTLSTVAGPAEREQRTYVMTQDTAAPQNFGVDEVVFSFTDEKAAADFATTLRGNMSSCPKRSSTAKLDAGPALSETIAGKPMTAGTYLVTQSLGSKQTARFRVGVGRVGTKVVYLLSNPSQSYDLGEKAYDQLIIRAAQRASQVR